jgi:hypothetical protein
VSDGITRLLTALRDPGVVPLAAAYLDPATLKVAALNRIAAALAPRGHDPGRQGRHPRPA